MSSQPSTENLHGIEKQRSHDCLRYLSCYAVGFPPNKRARLSELEADDHGHRPVSNPTPLDGPPASDNGGSVDKDERISAWLSSLGSGPDSPESEEQTTEQTLSTHMDLKRDAEGFLIPPARTRSAYPKNTASEVSASAQSTKSLVETPLYRLLNLQSNNIHLLPTFKKYPEEIGNLVRSVKQDRSSPGPSVQQLENDSALQQLENGAIESDVEQYFSGNTFPAPGLAEVLRRTDRQPMVKDTVPRASGVMYGISNPVPDMLFGYSVEISFAGLAPRLLTLGGQPFANTANLVYPFLVVEFKGEGGSLWAATNQCLGAASACVNMIEQLHRKCEAYHINGFHAHERTIFSVAISGTEARVFVSWLDNNGQNYYTQKIRSFCLQEADHHIAFRRYVRNITDWGVGRRLEAIKDALVRLTDSEEYKASLVAAQARSRSRSRPRSDSVDSDNASVASMKRKRM